MTVCNSPAPGLRRKRPVHAHQVLALCLLAGLSACAESQSPYNRYSPGSGAYRAPGTPDDPWGPYIIEASQRFSIPAQWIRAVIHQESGGHEYLDGQPITSSAGAMGLMQLMPGTYSDMENQFSLGSDPYEPHDNIMAGTGYISILSAKYGAPGFLAAYNAGPQRLEDYLYRNRDLPDETVQYVAAITPNLGSEVAMTGPLAAYASDEQLHTTPSNAAQPIQYASYVPQTRVTHTSASCYHDPDAAYDPSAPCMAPPTQPIVVQPPLSAYGSAVGQRTTVNAANCYHDPNAAFDPSAPCESPPVKMDPIPNPPETQAAPADHLPRYQLAALHPVIPSASAQVPAYGSWAVQVGAFSSEGQARFANTMARQAAFAPLRGAQSVVQPIPSMSGRTVFRARLTGLAHNGAASACSNLQTHGLACMIIPPGH